MTHHVDTWPVFPLPDLWTDLTDRADHTVRAFIASPLGDITYEFFDDNGELRVEMAFWDGENAEPTYQAFASWCTRKQAVEYRYEHRGSVRGGLGFACPEWRGAFLARGPVEFAAILNIARLCVKQMAAPRT